MNTFKFGALVLSLTGVLAATPSLAATTWTMANGYPDNSFFTKNIRQFIDEVQTKSDGDLKINLFSNGSLVKHDSIKRAVRSGQIQIGGIRLAVYSNEDAMFGLDNVPNLVSTYDDARKLMQAQKPYFDKMLAKQDLEILAYVPWPGQGFYTAGPVKSLKSLKDKSVRIYSTQTKTMAQMLGMKATILPFADIPQAFSTGLIDSLWTSAQTGTDIQAWDQTKYFTFTGSMHNKNAILVNLKALKSLDKKTREIVIAAGKHATDRGWKLSEAAAKDKIDTLEKNGMTIAQAPKDVMAKMSDIGKTMAAEWRKSADKKQVAVLKAYYAAEGK